MVDSRAVHARNSLDHLPSTIDNMRSKEKGYKAIESARSVLCDQVIEQRYRRAIATNVYTHNCSVWSPIADFLDYARLTFMNRNSRRRARDITAPDSTVEDNIQD